jgi:hypothetical protein
MVEAKLHRAPGKLLGPKGERMSVLEERREDSEGAEGGKDHEDEDASAKKAEGGNDTTVPISALPTEVTFIFPSSILSTNAVKVEIQIEVQEQRPAAKKGDTEDQEEQGVKAVVKDDRQGGEGGKTVVKSSTCGGASTARTNKKGTRRSFMQLRCEHVGACGELEEEEEQYGEHDQDREATVIGSGESEGKHAVAKPTSKQAKKLLNQLKPVDCSHQPEQKEVAAGRTSNRTLMSNSEHCAWMEGVARAQEGVEEQQAFELAFALQSRARSSKETPAARKVQQAREQQESQRRRQALEAMERRERDFKAAELAATAALVAMEQPLWRSWGGHIDVVLPCPLVAQGFTTHVPISGLRSGSAWRARARGMSATGAPGEYSDWLLFRTPSLCGFGDEGPAVSSEDETENEGEDEGSLDWKWSQIRDGLEESVAAPRLDYREGGWGQSAGAQQRRSRASGDGEEHERNAESETESEYEEYDAECDEDDDGNGVGIGDKAMGAPRPPVQHT